MILNKLEFMLMNNPVRRLLQDKIEARKLRTLSSLPQNKVILEIGCGSGYGSRLIKKYFHPREIQALDLDPRMIALAKKRGSDPSISFRVGSAARLPYKDRTFDAVIEFAIIHHIPDWKNCLKELQRVLRPGGEIILEDLSRETFETTLGKMYKKVLQHPYSKMYYREEFVEYLQELGFKIKVKKVYSPFHLLQYFIVVAQKPTMREKLTP